MFRIKTDIRHYRCDSRDRVERLIRNWVIRPADLIYDDEDDDWFPIGEHPAFVEIFETLNEQHENQPETVVTPSAADKAAADRVAANRNGAADRRGRPARTSTPAPTSTASTRGGDDIEPRPPEPDEEVVGVIRDSDEITLMTDRTRALMIEKRGDAEVAVEAESVEGAREPTELIERPDSPEQANGVVVADEEPTNRIERHRVADEPTDRFERPRFDDEPPEPPDEQADVADEPTERLDRSELDGVDDPGGEDNIEPQEPTDRFRQPRKHHRSRPPETTPPAGERQNDAADSPSVQGLRDLPEELVATAPMDEPDQQGVEGDGVDEQPPPPADIDATSETADAEPIDVEAVTPVGDGPDQPADSTAAEPDEDPEELDQLEVSPVADEVYDGYDIDLPFAVGPSAVAVKMGLQRSSVSRHVKQRRFPPPEPKTPGEVVTATYRLGASTVSIGPYTLELNRRVVVAAAAVAVVLAVLVLAALL